MLNTVPSTLRPLRLDAQQQLQRPSYGITLDQKLKLQEAIESFDDAFTPRSDLRLPAIINQIDTSVDKLTSIVSDIHSREQIHKLPPLTCRAGPADSNAPASLSKTVFRAATKGDLPPLHALLDDVTATSPVTFRTLATLTNSKHQTLLHVGALKGHVQIVKFVFSFSSSYASDVASILQSTDYKGRLPIHSAIIGENHEVFFEILNLYWYLEQHLNTSILLNSLCSSDGLSTLHLVFKYYKCLIDNQKSMGVSSLLTGSNKPSCLGMLITKLGCNVNIRDSQLKTPLHYLVSDTWHDVANDDVMTRHQYTILSEFLSFNPVIDIKDGHHHVPLFYAIQTRNASLVKLLLNHRANPNLIDQRQGSMLNLAVESGSLEVVKCLVESGADPTFVDGLGYSPLHSAVYTSNSPRRGKRKGKDRNLINIALYLLSNGASMNDSSRFRTSVRDLAVKSSFKQL
ncbi:hypothetical protein P9112_009381 [Eukaryota sp. TZLM1-RC]